MTAKELYGRLRALQEPKGYYFNTDTGFVMELLDGLLVNKERYGYMACPCRLAEGERGADKDIICPCVYRDPDVAEYGACFCGLYVSNAWNEGALPRETVPDRREPRW
jgi:ferredoxin-thioredoxin reductase catalytic subunit